MYVNKTHTKNYVSSLPRMKNARGLRSMKDMKLTFHVRVLQVKNTNTKIILPSLKHSLQAIYGINLNLLLFWKKLLHPLSLLGADRVQLGIWRSWCIITKNENQLNWELKLFEMKLIIKLNKWIELTRW